MTTNDPHGSGLPAAGATSYEVLSSDRAGTSAAPRSATDALLEVRDLNVRFPTEDGLVHAVRGVDYVLRPREVLGIVGESGSGKSVTSLAVMGLLPASARITGSVLFRGEELLGMRDKDMSRLRGSGISMIFQDPMTSLDPVYRVGDQIEETLRIHDRNLSRKAATARAVELLEMVGIPQAGDRVRDYPHAFSGGMRQRVVIAIAMANQPDVIIADEPTTALDVTVQAQILEVLGTALEETGAAMVLITHDLGVVAGMADRVLVMYAGRPIEVGGVEDIYYQPRMPYTLGLLGSLPRLDSTTREQLTPIVGAPPSMLNMPPGCPFAPRCPLHIPECDIEEPPLIPVGPAHTAACIRTEVVAAAGGQATEVFEAGVTDTLLVEGAPGTLTGGIGADEPAGTPPADQTEPTARQGGETGTVTTPRGDRA